MTRRCWGHELAAPPMSLTMAGYQDPGYGENYQLICQSASRGGK